MDVDVDVGVSVSVAYSVPRSYDFQVPAPTHPYQDNCIDLSIYQIGAVGITSFCCRAVYLNKCEP